MANANTSQDQQSKDAIELDQQTSLQQPSDAEHSGIAKPAEVRGDNPVTPHAPGTPASPGFFTEKNEKK